MANPDTPQVFQSEQREGFVKGRRSSTASNAGNSGSEVFVDYTHDFADKTFAIRFDEYDEIQATIHIDNYTNKEIKRTWYRKKDYENMVKAARKAVNKAEKSRSKKKDEIDQRGLESWTLKGSERSRLLKDNAVEAVWNEQTFQWDKGVFDPDRIRDCYIPFSTGALDVARRRASIDSAFHKKEVKKVENEERKRKQNILSRSKAAIGKSINLTRKRVVKTTRIVGDATSQTGMVALTAGKRTARASLGVATLDQRMVKEAFAQNNMEDERVKKSFRLPSQMSILSKDGNFERDAVSPLPASNALDSSEHNLEEELNPENLKLFGLVPLPGTKKMYEEDLEKEKLEKRKSVSQLPSWEASRRNSGKI